MEITKTDSAIGSAKNRNQKAKLNTQLSPLICQEKEELRARGLLPQGSLLDPAKACELCGRRERKAGVARRKLPSHEESCHDSRLEDQLAEWQAIDSTVSREIPCASWGQPLSFR